MKEKNISDVKIEFIVSVYESIQNQIRQSDLKISLVLSWVSITAVLLGREVATIVSQHVVNPFTICMMAFVLISLSYSGVFIFGTLKPRTKPLTGLDYKGLLYTGDILNLAEEPVERMKCYLEEIAAISTHEQIYGQFVSSIISISEIAHVKNKMFLRALAGVAVGFAILVGLMAYDGIQSAIVR